MMLAYLGLGPEAGIVVDRLHVDPDLLAARHAVAADAGLNGRFTLQADKWCHRWPVPAMRVDNCCCKRCRSRVSVSKHMNVCMQMLSLPAAALPAGDAC